MIWMNYRSVIFQLIQVIDVWGSSCEITLRWLPEPMLTQLHADIWPGLNELKNLHHSCKFQQPFLPVIMPLVQCKIQNDVLFRMPFCIFPRYVFIVGDNTVSCRGLTLIPTTTSIKFWMLLVQENKSDITKWQLLMSSPGCDNNLP